MQTNYIKHAKKYLSKLIHQAVKNISLIFKKARKPLMKITTVEASSPRYQNRLGFMKGQLTIPKDFDEIGKEEISKLFDLQYLQ